MNKIHIYCFVAALLTTTIQCQEISQKKSLETTQITIPIVTIIQEPLRLTATMEQIENNSSDASIRIVYDKNYQFFVLKQIRQVAIDEQFLLINDLIASAIGYHLGIRVNNVMLIPAALQSGYKIFQNRAATLHTMAQGQSLEAVLPDFLSNDFTIHQRINSPWQKVPQHRMGLTQEILENMALHADLPPIVALDTFIGNADRSLPNIFFDPLTHHFCGIDHAAAFTKLLPALAIIRITELYEQGYFEHCPSEVLNALKIYTDTLRILSTPEITEAIIDALNKFSHHLLPCSGPLPACLEERIIGHRAIIEKNLVDSLELIQLLDTILTGVSDLPLTSCSVI